MADYDHYQTRLARADAQDREVMRQRAERAKKATESIADRDNSPAGAFRNTKRLRDRTKQAMEDQGV